MIANNEARLVNRAVIPTAIIKELTFNNRGSFCDGLIHLLAGKCYQIMKIMILNRRKNLQIQDML